MEINKIIKRPVLRYHGGKFILAPWIISHFPYHRVYVEPFGGAGSVLMRKERSYAEIYNDKWNVVVNVFRVLRDPTTALELERRLRLTPFSRVEFYGCSDEETNLISDPIERARRTILRSFAGFGSASTNGSYSTGFRANSNRSGTTPAHDWMNFPTHISSFVDRLKGVVIENRHYIDVFSQHDSAETLFYLDPPYMPETRNLKRGNAAYAHEFTIQDHIDLASSIHNLKGKVVISGYHTDLYDNLYKGWMKVVKNTYGDGAVKRVEVLWISPSCHG
jgi:DNA adenine methylase